MGRHPARLGERQPGPPPHRETPGSKSNDELGRMCDVPTSCTSSTECQAIRATRHHRYRRPLRGVCALMVRSSARREIAVALPRSRRLEAAFGAALSEVTAEHVRGLVTSAVQEDFDLDFKAQMYGNSDADKRDLATDVAAMANSAGGVIVIGVEENEHAQAVAAPGVAISDEVERRILQITAGISPAPAVTVRRISLDEAAPGHGFVLIATPRSLAAPHAVVVNATSLRYPVRHGTTTRYMSPSEVATAYRQRVLAEAEQPRRAADAEAQAQELLAGNEVWVQVSVTPELAGSVRIDTAMLRSVQADLAHRPSTVFSNFSASPNTRAGHRRIMASSRMHGGPPFEQDLIQLHSDGTGTWTHALWNLHRSTQMETGVEPPTYLISDEALVEAAISGAALLVEHARDRAQAAGQVLIRVRVLNRTGGRFALGHTRGLGLPDAWPGSFAVTDIPVAETHADLDEIAAHVPQLLVALYPALTDLFQSFGVAELAQLTDEAQLRWPYWNNQRRPAVEAWAQRSGVAVIDEPL